MIKKVLALFIFISQFFFSQMDTEHWFAPIYQNNNAGISAYLYLSTDQSTPFTVSVYSGNVLVQTTAISKGNPAQLHIDSILMFSDSITEALTPIKKGLFVIGEKRFFANLRFEVPNHAEFVTSKGKAALGTKFYAVPTPLAFTATDFGFTVGIIATEDKTNVTISGYKPSVMFVDGTNPTQLTVKLNKGESYLIAGDGSLDGNRDSFVGAKIVSDKAVAVVNGNMNGNISPRVLNNRDIYMDESVPVDRLGTDFVVMKGNARIGDLMERPIVVATENGTQVYLNDEVTTYEFTDIYGNKKSILNEGEYGIISDTKYINQGNSVYNLAIKSTKKVYVYQNLGGTAAGSFATGGFNYIPPLSCFLPNRIDEIPDIDKIGFSTFNAKINIITEKGATVTYNGTTLSGAFGPYPVTGNSAWDTYVVGNATGNATIISTKSLTAGIAAGSGAVGYGGYFAGFNSVPVISKGGDCDKGFYLEVDNSYDSYQWYYNGVIMAGETSNRIYPADSGQYYVIISKKDCGNVTTPVYNFVACSLLTSKVFTIGSCNTITIQPKFTKSPQNIVLSSIKIKTPPTNGIASVNATTGEITYVATNLSATSDKFVYYFSGNDPEFPDAETVTVNITLKPLIVYNGVSKACVNSGIGRFNIDEVKLTDDTAVTYRYFKTLDAANNLDTTQEILTLHPYLSDAGIIYVRITDSFGCYKIAEIELRDSQPNVDPNNYNSSHCDDNLDGKIDIKFSDISPIIVHDYNAFTIEYFDNPGYSGTPLPNNWSYTKDTDVYVRVFSQTSCVTAKGIIHFAFGDKISVKDNTSFICDSDFNNTENVNLSKYLSFITTETGYTPTYYNTLSDANNKLNSISANQTITKNTTFYVRFEKSGICPNVAAINLLLNQPKISTILKDQIVCNGSITTLDAGPGFDKYEWSTGARTQTIDAGAGNYYVDLYSNGCVHRQNVKITESPKANFNISAFNGTNCDENFDGKIEVDFSKVTPIILRNYTLFKVRYYDNLPDATAGNTNFLPTNWSYSQNTTVYVRVDSDYCPVEIKSIDFKFGNQVPLLTDKATEDVCDDNLDGEKSVNLTLYKSDFSADNNVIVRYFAKLDDAKLDVNPITAPILIKGSQTFYLRLSKAGICSIIAELTINIKTPKASTTLKDSTTCPGVKATLDAGSGFESYLWSTGEKTQTISAGPGTYSVTLFYNGCPYIQSAKITEVELPEIKVIDIQLSTVTITSSGGNPPYKYAIDNLNYQTSNVFTNVKGGRHTLYVISADNCAPVTKEFTLIELVNTITPNGDGINDVLDYSALSTKTDVKFSIFDRYGNKLYEGSPSKNYSWDGTINSRVVSTGTYWYLLEWKEFGMNVPVKYQGWVFVKNY